MWPNVRCPAFRPACLPLSEYSSTWRSVSKPGCTSIGYLTPQTASGSLWLLPSMLPSPLRPLSKLSCMAMGILTLQSISWRLLSSMETSLRPLTCCMETRTQSVHLPICLTELLCWTTMPSCCLQCRTLSSQQW